MKISSKADKYRIMSTDSEEFDKHLIESRRIYNYLVSEFCNRFVWLRLKEQDIDPICDGLSTVLMDSYVNEQFVDEYKKNPEDSKKWNAFFDFIEEMIQSGDTTLEDTIDTTILELLAAEVDIDLESILPYCGSKTRESIYNSVRVYYGKPERADYLEHKYSL